MLHACALAACASASSFRPANTVAAAAVAPAGGGSSRYTHSIGSADDANLSSGSEDDDGDHDGVLHAHASDIGEHLSHQQRQHRQQQFHWGAAGSAAAAGAGAATDSGDEDDVCQWQGGLHSPLQQLQQQQEQGFVALRDISNSNKTAQGHHQRQQQSKPKQQRGAAGSSSAAAEAAAGAVHVEQDGRLLVEAQVLQLLLDKVSCRHLTVWQAQQ
jgi:hypothetical protein